MKADAGDRLIIVDKLKAIVTLGISCNLSTLIGITASWVFLSRLGWVEAFWHRVWISLALLPAFMADALNAYVLGRVRIEYEKGWDDIQITDAGRHALVRMYYPWRIVSFLTSTMLAASMLASFSPSAEKYKYVFWIFLILFAMHTMRCFYTIYAYITPRLPNFGGKALLKRAALVVIAAVPLMWWMFKQFVVSKSCWTIFLYGIIYFMISALMQPLPSKFSILRYLSGLRGLSRQPLTPMDINSQEITDDLRKLADEWRIQHGYVQISGVKMPLLEMPIFECVGIVMLAPDAGSMLLLLQHEADSKAHRTLVSWAGDNSFILTSDLGIQTMKLPSNIIYVGRSRNDTSATFLSAHAVAVNGLALSAIPDPPWNVIQSIIASTASSLAEGLRAPSEKPEITDSEHA